MTRIQSCILFFSLGFILSSSQNGDAPYQPYGPLMCRQLCEDVLFSYIYVTDTLSCYRIQGNTSVQRPNCSVPESFTCMQEEPDANDDFRTVIFGTEVCAADKPTGLISAVIQGELLGSHHPNCTTMLHRACRKGRLCVVKHILAMQLTDINYRQFFGRTPIMTAARNGQVEVFDFLFTQGSNLSVIDVENNSLLHLACIAGNMHMIKKLVETKKYDINATGYYGMTVLMRAAYLGRRDIFDFLVSCDCNVSAVDQLNRTILHWACYAGHVHLVDYIISHGMIPIDNRGPAQRTAVMVAASRGYVHMMDLLIRRGCNLTGMDVEVGNLFHIACVFGRTEILKYAVNLGIEGMEARNFLGRTPLMVAAEFGRREIFDVLKRKGCNMKAVDDRKNTLLHVACMGGNVDMVTYILSQNVTGLESKGVLGRTPVLMAAREGCSDVVDLLVQRGCDLTAVDENENTILHVACKGGNIDMVKYLMNKGIDRRKDRNIYDRTPMDVAQIRGYPHIVSLLEGWQ